MNHAPGWIRIVQAPAGVLMSLIPLLIGWTEFRRSVRLIFADRTSLLSIVLLSLLVVIPGVSAATMLAFFGGQALTNPSGASGTLELAADVVRGGGGLFWLLIVAMTAIRSATRVADLEPRAFLLVTTTGRQIVPGLFVAEFLRLGSWIVPASLLVAIGAGLGSRSLTIVVVGPIIVGFLLAAAIPVGFLIGCVTRDVLTVSRWAARLRVPVVLLLAVFYVISLITGHAQRIVETGIQALPETPFSWPMEPLLIALPGLEGDPVRALGGVGWMVGIAVISAVLALSIAERHWHREPLSTPPRRTKFNGQTLERLTGRLLDPPARGICITTLRRTWRAPVRTLYVVYPLFAALVLVAGVIREGVLPGSIVVALCLYVIWGTGALLALNPLGDLRAVLPLVLPSPVDGRSVMKGYLSAGGLIGVPVVILTAIGGGLISPLNNLQVALLTSGAVVGTVLAPVLAAGIGSLFPRFGSVQVTAKTKAIMPSKLAFAGYTLTLMLPAAAAVALASPTVIHGITGGFEWVLTYLDADGTVSTTWVRLLLLIPLAGGLGSTLLAYRYAVRRYNSFRVE